MVCYADRNLGVAWLGFDALHEVDEFCEMSLDGWQFQIHQRKASVSSLVKSSPVSFIVIPLYSLYKLGQNVVSSGPWCNAE